MLFLLKKCDVVNVLILKNLKKDNKKHKISKKKKKISRDET